MHPYLRNTLAIIAGFVLGSVVNMALINLGPNLIPPPADADITSMEGLAATMHLFEPKHFLFPFLAHALGTLVGAWVAAKIVANHKMRYAMIIGVLFFCGGIINVVLLPSPLWYSTSDLVLAYFPMAWLAAKLNPSA